MAALIHKRGTTLRLGLAQAKPATNVLAARDRLLARADTANHRTLKCRRELLDSRMPVESIDQAMDDLYSQ
ncbi:MAG: hypothetical protein KF752_13405 [Pirellulaceae bacterium]|nr:hypothetical protein [Pirellulaceae bacterium]